MRIGIATEVKPLEGRVGLVPEACGDLVRSGHQLFVQAGAGLASGFDDAAYRNAGATVLGDAGGVFGEAELIVRVKEPYATDLDYLRPDHTVFSYLHLAALPELTQKLCDIGLTAVGFETVQDRGALPLLAPMSDIAGRLSIQIAAHLLQRPMGGKGILLGGLPGAPRGRVVVVGAGHAGGRAVMTAANMGAEVTVFDKNRERLDVMHRHGGNVTALYPYADALGEAIAGADVLVGAVLIPGARTPHLVSRAQVASMGAGAVVADIAVDQGGCVETTRPASWDEPYYVEEGVTHFCVTNMPGAVPRTASLALSAVLIPYVQRLARGDWREDPVLAGAINVSGGRVIHPELQAQYAK
jgi:alanine dehydrogenase